MLDPKVEEFLENNNLNYLFLLLSNLEVKRLSNLPRHVKEKLNKKITDLALEHIANNNIPDYIFEDEPEPEVDDFS